MSVRKNDCPTSSKMRLLSFLCLTVPPVKIAPTLLFVSHCSSCSKMQPLSLLCLTVPPAKNMFTPVWCLTVLFTKIHILSFLCLIVPLALKWGYSLLCVSCIVPPAKITPTLLFVSHCPTCSKMQPLSLLCHTVPPAKNAPILLFVFLCPTHQTYIYLPF
jgi:hypothetical protein